MKEQTIFRLDWNTLCYLHIEKRFIWAIYPYALEGYCLESYRGCVRTLIDEHPQSYLHDDTAKDIKPSEIYKMAMEEWKSYGKSWDNQSKRMKEAMEMDASIKASIRDASIGSILGD